MKHKQSLTPEDILNDHFPEVRAIAEALLLQAVALRAR